MVIIAIIIKCTSKGPIIFSQVRVGLHNREFKMYKFRSMQVQSEAKEKKAWTKANDARVTEYPVNMVPPLRILADAVDVGFRRAAVTYNQHMLLVKAPLSVQNMRRTCITSSRRTW